MRGELSLPDAGGVTWSVRVLDDGGMPLGSVGADVSVRTASIGKVLLLLETARGLTEGELDPFEVLTRSVEEWVAGSGLWHTFSIEALPLIDVAALVAAVSDNLATNVLLRRVGLDAVARRVTELGLRATALHDRVRDERTSAHAATLSTGNAAELAALAARVCRGTAISPAADVLVRQWLSANVDLSMVGAAFVEQAGVDPITHREPAATEAADSMGGAVGDPATMAGGLLTLWNKTGADPGIRADIGAVTRDGRSVSWAAIANWDPAPSRGLSSDRRRDDLTAWAVLRGMRQVGELVLDAVTV